MTTRMTVRTFDARQYAIVQLRITRWNWKLCYKIWSEPWSYVCWSPWAATVAWLVRGSFLSVLTLSVQSMGKCELYYQVLLLLLVWPVIWNVWPVIWNAKIRNLLFLPNQLSRKRLPGWLHSLAYPRIVLNYINCALLSGVTEKHVRLWGKAQLQSCPSKNFT